MADGKSTLPLRRQRTTRAPLIVICFALREKKHPPPYFFVSHGSFFFFFSFHLFVFFLLACLPSPPFLSSPLPTTQSHCKHSYTHTHSQTDTIATASTASTSLLLLIPTHTPHTRPSQILYFLTQTNKHIFTPTPFLLNPTCSLKQHQHSKQKTTETNTKCRRGVQPSRYYRSQSYSISCRPA